VVIFNFRADRVIELSKVRPLPCSCMGGFAAERGILRGQEAYAGLSATRRSQQTHRFAITPALHCLQAFEYAEFDKFDRKRWPQTRFVGMMQVRAAGLRRGLLCLNAQSWQSGKVLASTALLRRRGRQGLDASMPH